MGMSVKPNMDQQGKRGDNQDIGTTFVSVECHIMERRLSKIVFAFEAIVLAYPTMLGILMAIGGVVPILTGAHTPEDLIEGAMGLTILLGLICGWRLAFGFLSEGSAHIRSVSRVWWYSATFTAASALLAFSTRFMSLDAWGRVAPLSYGVLFVPSYVHLLLEVWRRERSDEPLTM